MLSAGKHASTKSGFVLVVLGCGRLIHKSTFASISLEGNLQATTSPVEVVSVSDTNRPGKNYWKGLLDSLGCGLALHSVTKPMFACLLVCLFVCLFVAQGF